MYLVSVEMLMTIFRLVLSELCTASNITKIIVAPA